MVFVFTLTSVLTAALLFLVQPMVARMVLPAFGGSPQVWTTAMLFFQTALLAGYGYTHWATNSMQPRKQLWMHLLVTCLPLFFLPILLTVSPSGQGGVTPTLELLAALTFAVAVPFVVVATSGPLLQRWFSWTDHRHAQDPYFLYAAGNVGSIGGLLLYPFMIEPQFSIIEQSRLWMIGYWSAAGMLAICNLLVHRRMTASIHSLKSSSTADLSDNRSVALKPDAKISVKRIAWWLLLAFVPSSLMLAITAHLSTDVAAIPMLWVLPLSTYLLTFTIAFSRFGKSALAIAIFLTPVVVIAALCFEVRTLGINFSVALQVLLMLVGGLLAHGKLALDRPQPHQLTFFYLTLSVGGALGGLFNSLLAPLLFPTIFEYGIIATLTLVLAGFWQDHSRLPDHRRIPTEPMTSLVFFAIPLSVLYFSHSEYLSESPLIKTPLMVALLSPLLLPRARRISLVVATLIVGIFPSWSQVNHSQSIQRTFFGVHRVINRDHILQLVHGTTSHGRQDISSLESRLVPLSYYHPDQPLGQVMQLFPPRQSVGIIGLGAGSIAAYAYEGQSFTFHEIDPVVIEIAERDFYFLRDARDRRAIIATDEVGDGRLTLQHQPRDYQLLVVDAFSSDAIPVHLLTIEAIQVYLDSITDDGIIAIHISNNYLELAPVLSGAAEELGLAMLQSFGKETGPNVSPSHWVAIAKDHIILEPLQQAGWRAMPERRVIWTDQRSSIWSVRKW